MFNGLKCSEKKRLDKRERRFVKPSNCGILVEIGVTRRMGNGLTSGTKENKCLFSEFIKTKIAQIGSL